MSWTVGIISPGDMGSAIGERLASDDRSSWIDRKIVLRARQSQR